MTDKERLDFLLCSEAIAKVDAGELRPLDLDRVIKNMKKRIRELEYTHQLDQSEIFKQTADRNADRKERVRRWHQK